MTLHNQMLNSIVRIFSTWVIKPFTSFAEQISSQWLSHKAFCCICNHWLKLDENQKQKLWSSLCYFLFGVPPQMTFRLQLPLTNFYCKHSIKAQPWERHSSSTCSSVITTVRSPTCTHWSYIDLCMRNSGFTQFSILTFHFHSIFWLKDSSWMVKSRPPQIKTKMVTRYKNGRQRCVTVWMQQQQQ